MTPSSILDFGFSMLVSIAMVFTNEAIFSEIFPVRMKNITIEQQFLEQDFTSQIFKTSFNVLNDIELEDLESIMSELAQGLASDTEGPMF